MTKPFAAAFVRGLNRAMLAAAALLASSTLAQAGTTGQISGTVTDAANNAPLSGVLVTASAPTGTYKATTDAKGFYSLTGVTPDTLTVTFSKGGYDLRTVPGVTVVPDQTVPVSVKLSKTAKTIGTVNVRGASSAFQPSQTIDTYTETASRIDTALGKKNNLSETNLIRSVPGVTATSYGSTSLRGGLRTEIGFQYEGIDYTDALSSQFVNSLALNGIDQLQVTPGAGDASQGNSGTGVINIISKRGTYPASGSLDLEALMFPYSHQAGFEYGFATPNGRMSEFFSFVGGHANREYGFRGADSTTYNFFSSVDTQDNVDFVNNLIFRYGPNNNTSIQAFYQGQAFRFGFNKGGINGLCYKTCDPLANLILRSAPYAIPVNAQKQIVSLLPGQVAVDQPVGRQSASYQPNQTLKLQWSKNIDAGTYLALRYYKVNAVVVFDLPWSGPGTSSRIINGQGSLRTGSSGELTKQLNDKNLGEIGYKYEFAHGIFDDVSNIRGLISVSNAANAPTAEFLDFLPPAFSTVCITQGPCGYLAPFFGGAANVPKVPIDQEIVPVDAQYWAVFAQDTFSPTDRLKILGGLRLDGANIKTPDSTMSAETGKPRVLEPHFGFTYQLTNRDYLRATYGRSVEFPPLGDYYNTENTHRFDPFRGIPAHYAVCGPTGDKPCADYAQELFWEYQNTVNGVQSTPVKPETFANIDVSYGHQFPHNVAIKITPFYRRGYDVVTLATTVNHFDPTTGAPVFNPSVASNNGINKTTGIEFLLTKDQQFGFSGQLALTYINELSNVPPLPAVGLEDFFPSIPQASLDLGNLYRVGYLSPFQGVLSMQYRTRTGWRVNPIVTYNKGYPMGAGTVSAFYVNGKAYNLPSTNVTAFNGSTGADYYVDPQNPGSVFHPNIAAGRGTPDGASPGGFLSSARFNTNLSVEYSPPGANSTFGVLATNLFNQLYGLPFLNPRWQPIATGIGGPSTGRTGLAGFAGFANYTADQFGYAPFVDRPNQFPVQYRFYYQQKF